MTTSHIEVLLRISYSCWLLNIVSVTMHISGPSFAFSTSGIGFLAFSEKSAGLIDELCVVDGGLI